jgi:hypothetical protein
MAKKLPTINTGDMFWDAVNEFGKNYPDIMSGKVTVEEGLKATQDAVAKMGK